MYIADDANDGDVSLGFISKGRRRVVQVRTICRTPYFTQFIGGITGNVFSGSAKSCDQLGLVMCHTRTPGKALVKQPQIVTTSHVCG